VTPSVPVDLQPSYFGGVAGSVLGVVLVPEFVVEELGVVVEVPDFVPEEPVVDPELPEVVPDVLLEALLEALAGAVGVVPAGVVNIGTRG
jgi:hypothetical protein